MTSFKKLIAASTSLCLLYSAPSLAQEEETEESSNAITIDEIVVVARKREENLQDIPVSITVLNSDLLAEQNVISQGDLAELIPGLWYNEGDEGESDRIAALPSIRGISSSEIATNRTKVTSFVDGIPVIGSVGAINIGGATQVEVFSGPQSAAFGRSTFAGAINYVTRDPGEEIEGSVGINWSDQGTRIISGNVGGPLVEGLLGFQLGGSYEDSVAPEDYYTYFPDGTEAGTRGGENYSARLVFTPTDRLSAKLTFAHDETDDGITARNFYATQASAVECFNTLDTFDLVDPMGMGTIGSFAGTFDCELDREPSARLLGIQNIGAFYRTTEGEALLEGYIAAISDVPGDDMGTATPSDLELTTALATNAGFDNIQDAMLAIADAYSVPDEFAGSQSERDRVQLQLDYVLDNDSLIQLSFMEGDETYIRDYLSLEDTVPPNLGYIPESTDMMTGLVVPAGIGWIDDGMVWSMSDPTEINETYAEVRWASPADSRIRYVLGASYYNYDFITEIYEEAYNTVRLGTEQQIYDLTGQVVAPGRTISEISTNTAVFFNVSYDFTDRITGSIEARYSNDDVGAEVYNYTADEEGNVSTERYEDAVETKTLSPRLALNYAIDDDTTAYFQYAIGVSPAGINSDFLDPDISASFYEGYSLDLNQDGVVDDGEVYIPADNVNYELERYSQFEEETLTNYEIGFKGSAFDNRVTYTAALYHMIWEDQINRSTVDWENSLVTNDEDLYYTPVGTTGDLYIPASEDLNVETGVGGFDVNEGESTTTGLELQANYRINDNWSINGNTALMRAEYTDYCDVDSYSGNADVLAGDGSVLVYGDLGSYAGLATGTSPEGDDCYILDGKKLARTPSLTLSLSPSYRTEFGNGIGFTANTRFQYSGTSYNQAENISKTPSSFRVNLTFGLTWDNFSGSFYIQNLLDDTSVNSGNFTQAENYRGIYGDDSVDDDLTFMTSPDSDNIYSTFEYAISTGRNFGARLNYRF